MTKAQIDRHIEILQSLDEWHQSVLMGMAESFAAPEEESEQASPAAAQLRLVVDNEEKV